MHESIVALRNRLTTEGIDPEQFTFAIDDQMVNYLAGYYRDTQLVVTRTVDGKSMKMDANLVLRSPWLAVIDMRRDGIIP